MQVVDDGYIPDFEFVHRQQIVHRFAESHFGLVVAQVAEVLANQDFAFDDQGDRVFKIGPAPESAPLSKRQTLAGA